MARLHKFIGDFEIAIKKQVYNPGISVANQLWLSVIVHLRT